MAGQDGRGTLDAGRHKARIAREADHWVVRMHGETAADHEADFRKWVSASPDHARAYKAREILYRSEQLSTAGLAYGHAPLTRIWYADPKTLGAIAALALTLLAISWFAFARPPRPEPQTASLSASASAIRQIALEDGTLLTLDHGARVSVFYSKTARRIVLLAGRARFDVAHEANRPFLVQTGQGDVTAVGTMFDVALAGNKTDVRLFRGAVLVRAGGAGAARQDNSVRLSQGHAVELGAKAGLSPVRTLDPTPEWASGLIAYENVSIAAIVESANRTGRPSIILQDATIGRLRMNGTLRIGYNGALAAQLAAAFGLSITRSEAGDIILSRR